jgi:uncharacterized protein HemX
MELKKSKGDLAKALEKNDSLALELSQANESLSKEREQTVHLQQTLAAQDHDTVKSVMESQVRDLSSSLAALKETIEAQKGSLAEKDSSLQSLQQQVETMKVERDALVKRHEEVLEASKLVHKDASDA